MAINLDTQYGPFPLKIWLIIGVGGIGIGLFVASRQNSGREATTSDKGLATPPQVFFSKVTIGLEHVPGVNEPKPPIKAEPKSPIMPSNPVARPSLPAPIIRLDPPVFIPKKQSTDYTAVAPNVWEAFIGGRGVTAADVEAANKQAITSGARAAYLASGNTGLDASGNAYF